MKRSISPSIPLLLAAVLAGPAGAVAGFIPQATATPGSVPQGINYQGRLDDNGVPVTATKQMTFRVYDAPAAGNLMWAGTSQFVRITVGLFNAVVPVPVSALVGGGARYLEVQIDGTTMSPREPLNSVPYALIAKSVEGTIDVSTAGLSILPNSGTNTPALFISSQTGNVGIGTASPASKLHMSSGTLTVDGTGGSINVAVGSVTASAFFGDGSHLSGISGSLSGGTANYIPVWAGATTQGSSHIADINSPVVTTTMTVLDNAFSVGGSTFVVAGGNVGVGTTQLDQQFNVLSQISSAARGILDFQRSNDAAGPLIFFRKDRGAGVAVTNGDVVGNLASQAYDGTGYMTGSSIKSIVNGPVSAGVVPTDLQFFTGDGTSLLEQMRITSGGNLGIGTTNPASKLHMSSGTLIVDGTGGSINVAVGSVTASAFFGDGSHLSGMSGLLSGGAANYIPVWTGATTQGSSHIADINSPVATTTMTVLGNAFSVGGSTFVVVGGNVGIGATNPTEHLTVSANANSLPAAFLNTLVRIAAADGVNTDLLGLDTFASIGKLTFRRADGTAASPSALASGDVLGRLGFAGHGTSGYSSIVNAYLEADAGEAWTDTANGTYMFFDTTANGTTLPTERMRIDNAGNIGIGTTNPATKLHMSSGTLTIDGNVMTSLTTTGNVGFGTSAPNIHGYGNTGGLLTLQNPASQVAEKGVLELANSTDADLQPIGDIAFSAASQSGAADKRSAMIRGFLSGATANNRGSGMSFFTRADGGVNDLVERLQIDNGGNVGIGTNGSAAGPLDVRSPASAEATLVARFTDLTPTPMVEIFDGNDATAPNAANAVLKVKKALTTGRSINATGTINAAGADYAEWIPWTAASRPEPGTIIRYKSTAMVVSSSETAAFVGNDRIDTARAILVAFMGQVPVKVKGPVKEGDYIVPAGDGAGTAVPPDRVTFAQYRKVVGIAWETNAAEGVRKIRVAVGIK
jgi:hypothetical protein